MQVWKTLLLSGIIVSTAAMAENDHAKSEKQALQGIVKNLVSDNSQFVRSHKPAYFKSFMEGQHPRATVVTCADSRVHESAWDKTADGDLFVVRNIGNQLDTAEGSVEYGVHHLHTPLLIFVGHSACGAIKAASGDYSALSSPIRKELDTIHVNKGVDNMAGVETNVHNQVQAAVKKFHSEVDKGELTVMGAVYDFRNDLKKGQGQLVIIDVNGEADAKKVSQKISAMTQPIKTSSNARHH